jgi:hypothetical protein
MATGSPWIALGDVDTGRGTDGVITLPKHMEASVGGDILLVRTTGNGADDGGRRPALRLGVAFGGLSPVVSTDDAKRLSLSKHGKAIEGRGLSRLEGFALRALRVALPSLAFIAGAAVLVGAISSNLKDTMDIVTAAAAIPAAAVAVLNAIIRP